MPPVVNGKFASSQHVEAADSEPDAMLRHVAAKEADTTILDEPSAKWNSRKPMRKTTTESMRTADLGCAKFC